MKHLLITIMIAIFSAIDVTAQEQTTQNNTLVDSLIVQINQLQHDYDFLYCQNILEHLQFDLKTMDNDLQGRANGIMINCQHNNYDIDLYIAYRDNYDSAIRLFDSIKEKVEANRTLVAMKMITSNFSTSELELLRNNYNFIDNLLSTIDSSLKYYKTLLDFYRNLR